MLSRLWRLLRGGATSPASAAHGARCVPDCEVNCATPCRIADLPVGVRAIVVRVACPQADAHRLKVLGLFEGSAISIVDRRSGVLLEVRGSRLAIATTLAASITAMPIT
jgi:Fe2+ transport system protein FeoA